MKDPKTDFILFIGVLKSVIIQYFNWGGVPHCHSFETFCTFGDIYPMSAFCLCPVAHCLPVLASATWDFSCFFTENSCLTQLNT